MTHVSVKFELIIFGMAGADSFSKKLVKEIVVEYKIILIDGERLANLMIDHSIGLSTVNTYHVKIIGSDYFEES